MKSRVLSMTSGWVTEPGTWSRDEESLAGASNLDLSSPGVIAKRRGFSNNTLNSYSGSIFAVLSSPALEVAFGAGACMLGVGDPRLGVEGFRVGTRASTFAGITGSFASNDTNRPKLTTGPDGRDIVTTYVNGGNGGPIVPDYGALTARYLGVPRGMGFNRVTTATSGTTGWLPAAHSARYAVTFSLGDPLTNGTQEGAPGMTTVVNNTTVNPVDILTRVPLPVQFNTASTALPADTYWLNVYRSVAQATALGEPPSELALVYQTIITSTDISNGFIQFTDVVPDLARGANLYANINTGEDGITGRGFINSNEPPPMAKDVATWADCVWLASVLDAPTQEVQLISVGAPGLAAADTFTVGGVTFTAVAGAPASTLEFQISGAGAASVNQRETALNLVDAINREPTNTACYAYYTAGVVGQPGRIILRARTQTSTLSASTSNAVAFRIGTEDAGVPALNGLAFSKPLQPHAFPAVNFFQLGRGDAEIMRIVPYRDSLFVFKQDGLWRVTGTDFRNFSPQEFDLTFRLIAREAVTALDDAIYAWGVQGLARITDGGVEYIDTPIRNEVISAVQAVETATMTEFAWAVGKPRDGVVLFFYPTFDTSDSSDPDNIIPSSAAFVWHARTRTWSLWDMQGDGLAIGYSCGCANVTDGLLTLGVWQEAPASGAYIHNERRAYAAADFSDPDMSSAGSPTMAAANISASSTWRPLSSDALGSAQWVRIRIDGAAADSTRAVGFGLVVQMVGDNGTTSTAILTQATTGGSVLPRGYVAPVSQDNARSHALQLIISNATLNEGMWLVSTAVDYRPFSAKAIR